MKKYLSPLILILCLLFAIPAYSADLYSTYDQRIKLTVSNTNIDAELTWFPITVFLTSTAGEEVFAEFDADADFDRVAFTTSDGSTQVYADCELFDDSEQKAIYHIAKTGVAISNTGTTDFYMYYDNDASSNSTYISMSGGTAAQSVYDANYKAVYHMADNTTVDIDVGSAATDRASDGGAGLTLITKSNPANFTGRITSIEVWAGTNLVGLEVGTFYVVSGDNLTCRDSQAIGAVTAGSKQTIPVDIRVRAGDYLGYTFTAGTIDYDVAGSDGYWSIDSDKIPCTNQLFGYDATGLKISIYATGVIDILDSTSNNNDGGKKGAGEPVEATGKVGQGQNFDGSDDEIDLGNQTQASSLDITAELTIEAIVYSDDDGAYQSIVSRRAADATPQYQFLKGSDNKLTWYNGAGGGAFLLSSTSVIPTAEFRYLAATYKNADTSYAFYQNGAADGSGTASGKTITSQANYTEIGRNTYDTTYPYPFDGIIDEVRISNSVRTAAWLKATYYSLWDGLLTYGSEETAAVSGANILFIFSNF